MVEAALAVIGAVVAALLWGRWSGKRASDANKAADDARAYRETRERIDNATADDPGPDHVREWLRERGAKSRRDL
jgi:hypothetical protein